MNTYRQSMSLRKVLVAALIALACLCGTSRRSLAVPGKKAIREAVEYVMRKMGRKVTRRGLQQAEARLARLAEHYGDDAVKAFRKSGPVVFEVAEEAGEHAPQALRLIRRYGDDVIDLARRPATLQLVKMYGDDIARPFIKHGMIVEPVVKRFGRAGAKAMESVSARNARRIAMMADEGGALADPSKARRLLELVARGGDKTMEFIWKHKSALAVSAALVAFLNDPQPFIDGTRDLTQVVMKEGVHPAVENLSRNVGKEVARGTNWTVVFLPITFVLALLALLRWWPVKRPRRPIPGDGPGRGELLSDGVPNTDEDEPVQEASPGGAAGRAERLDQGTTP